MKKTKFEWSGALIVMIVFGMIGTVFTAPGAVFTIFIEQIAASPGSRGNVYLMPWIFLSVSIVFLLIFAVLLTYV